LFDTIHLASYRVAKIVQIPNPLGGGDAVDILEMISLLWLIGFLVFCITRMLHYRKTIQLFQRGKIQSCASYFHRFSSKIYLPPDFQTAYSDEEQKMLFAHEQQHIAQHDPFMYRLLMILECFFWFNPLVLKVVRMFQHERELLCDERVTRTFSKYEYGLLILKSAQRGIAIHATAGIVSEGSLKERVTSMITPIVTISRKAAAAVVFVTALLLMTGIIGFRPAWLTYHEINPILMKEWNYRELHVSTADSLEIINTHGRESPYIESMEQFLVPSKYSITINAQEMYKHALSLGFDENQWIRIDHIHAIRPDWGGSAMSTETNIYQVSDLNTPKPIVISYKEKLSFYQKITEFLL
jgi:beta-lactamase regulating signal transducer with metallopeptidase domain